MTGEVGDVLAVEGLTISSRRGDDILVSASCQLAAGGRIAIVGESGAGKATLALAALGVVRPGLRRVAGSVHVAGTDVFARSERARRSLRRRHTAWLGQDPAVALTPTMPVGRQLAELLDSPTPEQVAARLRAVSLPDDAAFLARLPRELSGGQQRRVALARALATRPRLVVLDEPTAGLDPVTGHTVIAEIDRLQAELGFALLVVTHDLALAARTCDDLLVLRHGRIVETGSGPDVLARPRHEHTRRLVDAYPSLDLPDRKPFLTSDRPVLEVRDLHAGYDDSDVLSGVSLEVRPGECVAVIGTSGSGKTTLARCMAGLHVAGGGEVLVDGTVVPRHAGARTRAQRAAVQLVPQDPFGTLHPRRSVLASVTRPLRLLHRQSRADAAHAAGDLLTRVGLSAADRRRRPSELSGGQRQRVALARALAARPRVLICDEITSALDSTIAAAVLDLIDRLRAELDLAVVFITHEFGPVRRLADRVVVLDAGRIGESGPVTEVFARPEHPVTASLLHASRSLSAALAARTPHPSITSGGSP